MESLLNAFRSLGPGRILALFIGIAAVIAISSLVVNRAQAPTMALLYGGLNAQEASRITDYLATQNIANEARGDGAIYVPSDKVGALRLQVAGQGLVGGSTTGYELFDNQSAFGTTNFVSNLNAKRALEGELARTIGTIPAVSGARVHIVLPKQNLFSREEVTPSAAIALNLGPRTLTPDQVQSIAQLVAAAVPNLTAAEVTIIDQRGTLLFDGKQQNDTASAAGTLRHKIEKSYEDSIAGMLERVMGPGNAVVRVTADLNLDKTTEQSELYDPTQQVVRSEQTVESTNTAADATNGGVTGVAANTPGGNGAAAAPGGSNSNEARNETTTNYEISKTVRSTSREGGDIKKLSVAVLVAGKAAAPVAGADATATGANAAPTFTPLTDEDRTRIRTLVETAIGFDATRGDKVEIVDMPFTPTPEAAAVAEPFLTKAQMLSLGQYALIVVSLIVVALFVVKPAFGTLNQALASGASSALLPSMGGMAGGPMGGGGVMPMGEGGAEDNSMIDIRSVQGRVRESAVKKVNEIIDQYPEESLGVVRNWMNGSSTQTDNS